MYQPGDTIIYSSQGVCRVLGVCHPPISSADPNKLYYNLSPLYSDVHIYIPVDTKVFMRPVIGREEAESLIRRLPKLPEKMYDGGNLNPTLLRNYYNSFLETNDCEAFFQLIKGIYAKTNGKQKMGQTDKAYMKRLEDLLYGELAVALEIPREQVVSYIEDTLRPGA